MTTSPLGPRPLLTLVLTAGLAACGDDSTPLGGGPVGSPDAGAPDQGSPDLGVEPGCSANPDCSGSTPYCDLTTGTCTPPPLAGAIGWGDETAESVTFEVIHETMQAGQSVDLEFSNERPNELWVLHREVPNDLPCESNASRQRGCAALEGSTTTIFDPGTPEQRALWIRDFNAWHFMRRPPAIAFGELGFFATCGEARTGNFFDDRADFIGPTLWTSDPSIYRNWAFNERPATWNGTHMDMLHATPNCMGIAHETGNAYWVANGNTGSLDRYDFNADHGPGQEDHSDGVIHRYAPGTLTRVPFVPGHIAFHEGKVYAADPGGSRIIVFDPTGARRSGALTPVYEPLQDSASFTGGTVTELVPPGTLQQPSGLEIRDGLLYVSDAATSRFHAFTLDGELVRSLDTGLPPGSLSGLALSPEGQLYFVNVPAASVLRVVPR